MCKDYENIQAINDLNDNLFPQIEHFFVSYNEMENRIFKPIGRPNRAEAQKLLDTGKKRFTDQKKSR